MPTIAETLVQAKACHRAGDLRSAEQLYRRVLEADAVNVEACFLLGTTCYAQGRLTEAVAILEQSARLKPDQAEIHDQLGVVLAADGNLDAAAASFRRALDLQPNYLPACGNLGNMLRHQGKLDEAAACYRRVLALNKDSALAHNDLGLISEAQGRLAEAEAYYRRAGELQANFVEAHSNLGTLLAKQGRTAEAVVSLRRALELRGDSEELHNNLGAALASQGKFDEAVTCCRRALELKSDYPAAYFNLALALKQQGKLDEAVASYRRAVELKPDYAEAHNNLAVVLNDQYQPDEAAACCRRALELKPDYAEAYSNLAVALAEQGKLDEAAICCRRALELKPNHAQTHNNLAVVLRDQNILDEAAAEFRRALELMPDYPEASSNLGMLLAQQGRVAEAEACYRTAMQFHPEQIAWTFNILSLCPNVFSSGEAIQQFRRKLLSKLEDLSHERLGFEPPALVKSDCRPSFNLQFHGHDNRPIREAYARLFRNSFPGEMPRCNSGRPRIGFMVTDWHEPLFLKSMGGVLERINPNLFELVVIGSARGTASLRSAIPNPALRFLPVPKKFEQIVEAIRAAHLDLLYYWEVGTDNTNYFLPFMRLAPVQCTSWGIQVTSGIPQLDHYISSALAEPEDAADHYTENLVLASTLLTYQRRVSLPDSPKPREYFGIAPDRHVYLCAQQLSKFQPDFDAILAGILRRDAQGVVVATQERFGPFIANQLRERFAATIPDVADRIVFVPFQPTADYLSLIDAADVLLDPLHFGGVNSSYDGFSLNKPIVTLPSRYQRGRYTLACYKKMGVSDCVASNPQQYIDIAVALGTDAEFRDQVEEKIRRASPRLFEDMEAVSEHERIFSALVEKARRCQHVERA